MRFVRAAVDDGAVAPKNPIVSELMRSPELALGLDWYPRNSPRVIRLLASPNQQSLPASLILTGPVVTFGSQVGGTWQPTSFVPPPTNVPPAQKSAAGAVY